MSTEDLQQFKQEFIKKLEEILPDMSEVFQKYGLSPEGLQLEVNLTQIQASGEDSRNKEIGGVPIYHCTRLTTDEDGKVRCV